VEALSDLLLVAVVLLNFFVLGTSRLRAVIRAVAAQGVILGLLPLLVHGATGPRALLVVVPPVVLKGIAIPILLLRALRSAQIKREVEPFLGFAPSLVLGAVGMAAALALSQRLPLLPGQGGGLVVPASLATVLVGFVLITTRLKAITQVLGYLVLENGIFLFGLLLMEAMPFLLEIAALLDLFVAVFVMGIILNHISREFSDIDTQYLSALRE
jgi:hydrogenase-4 component E